MSASLYSLTANYMAALDFLTDPEIEVDQQTTIDTLESIESTYEDKLINCAKFVESIGNQIDGMKAAEDRIKKRREALQNKKEWLIDYMRESMERTGYKKVDSAEISVSLQKNRPHVEIDDLQLVPFEFTRAKIEPIKSAILKAGGCPGARIVQDGFRLSIK